MKKSKFILIILFLMVFLNTVKAQQKFSANGNYKVVSVKFSNSNDKQADIFKQQLIGESFNVVVDSLFAGEVIIELTFMETEFTQPEKRGMAIFLNGNLLTPNLDVFKEAGGSFKPLVKRYNYQLKGNSLGIVFNGVGVNAILNEVKVLNSDGEILAIGDAKMHRDRITLGDSKSRPFKIIQPEDEPFYNVDHSPLGAFSTFIYGMEADGGVQMSPGRRAGIGDLVPHNGVILAVKSGNEIKVMPFSSQVQPLKQGASYVLKTEVYHHLNAASDSWQMPMGVSWKHYMPYWPLIEINKAPIEQIQKFVLPATWMIFNLDNTKGTNELEVLLSLKQNDVQIQNWGEYIGYTIEKNTAVAILENDAVLINASRAKDEFGIEGATSAFVIKVPANKQKNFTVIIAHYMAENFSMVDGEPLAFYFTNFYKNMGEVIRKAGQLKDLAIKQSDSLNALLKASPENIERKFQAAHSLQSYRFNTVLFKTEKTNKPIWGVVEGEYGYLNTFDLTVDHVFLELALHPWTIRNELDMFTKYFSYIDSLRYPNSQKRYPGGIGFSHDMGSGLKMMPGQAGYNASMTQEELQNWILCAGLYVHKTNDIEWLRCNQKTLLQCLLSMQIRDDVDSTKRDGITSLLSCVGKNDHDITTYDAMDKSLQQVNNSMYITMKSFASYLSLDKMFLQLGDKRLASQCRKAVDLTVNSILANWDETLQCFPAIFNDQSQSKIIPAVEGLIYPYIMGMKKEVSFNGPYKVLMEKLKIHLQTILKPGISIDPKTGGWFLSTTSNTTWQSKVFLSQYIAENILGIKDKRTNGAVDKAEYGFQVLGCPAVGWTDQITHSKGTGYGGRHYPRGVTSALWWLY